MCCGVGKAREGLDNELQPFCCFTYIITAHSPTLHSLHLHHSSFSNPSVALPTSQHILQPFRSFTYVTAHSPTLPSLYLHHRSFSNPSVASPTSQLILQPFRRFTYIITAHSPTLPSLHLHHSSFSNPSVALPTSQLILQPFRLFTYVTAHSLTFRRFTCITAHSPTLPSLLVTGSSLTSPGKPMIQPVVFMLRRN